MCLDVGTGATVYHPINSSDGNTCLSSLGREGVNLDQRCFQRTLVPSMREECMVNQSTIFFDCQFKCVDDIDFSAILCPKKCSQDYDTRSSAV